MILIMNVGTAIFQINAQLPHLAFTIYMFSVHIKNFAITFNSFLVFCPQKPITEYNMQMVKFSVALHILNCHSKLSNRDTDHTLPLLDVHLVKECYGTKIVAVSPPML